MFTGLLTSSSFSTKNVSNQIIFLWFINIYVIWCLVVFSRAFDDSIRLTRPYVFYGAKQFSHVIVFRDFHRIESKFNSEMAMMTHINKASTVIESELLRVSTSNKRDTKAKCIYLRAFIKRKSATSLNFPVNRKGITVESNSFTHPSFLPSFLGSIRKTFVILVFLLDFVIRFLATLYWWLFSLLSPVDASRMIMAWSWKVYKPPAVRTVLAIHEKAMSSKVMEIRLILPYIQ